MNEIQLREAIEDYCIKEMRKAVLQRLDDVLEDTITKAMQQVVITLYRRHGTGINFEIKVDFRKPDDTY